MTILPLTPAQEARWRKLCAMNPIYWPPVINACTSDSDDPRPITEILRQIVRIEQPLMALYTAMQVALRHYLLAIIQSDTLHVRPIFQEATEAMKASKRETYEACLHHLSEWVSPRIAQRLVLLAKQESQGDITAILAREAQRRTQQETE